VFAASMAVARHCILRLAGHELKGRYAHCPGRPLI
jgi:hypothetical protein